ncbi:MAG: M15 family metallopeptidase [Pseudomonadota bacterium]
MTLTESQLTGVDDSHIEYRDGLGLTPACWTAFTTLQQEAENAGFDLQIASAHRSFDRQRAIFNGKAAGERSVHDDDGAPVPIADLSTAAALQAILRFSALPGTSRHHWGTDLDVYDAAAMPAGYRVQLTPEEVADSGLFGPFHCWLDQRIASGSAQGFYRPYDVYRGGVSPERWHLSYAPEADVCQGLLSDSVVRRVLSQPGVLQPEAMAQAVLEQLPQLLTRYVRAVASAE